LIFSHIVVFILVMAVCEAYRPEPSDQGLWESFSWTVLFLAGLGLVSRLATTLLLRRFSWPVPPRNPARSTRRLEFFLQLAAALVTVALVTSFDLKAQLLEQPWSDWSEAVPGLASAALYFLCLALVWWSTAPLERRVFHQPLSAQALVGGQLRFMTPVLFPWLLVVVSRDLLTVFWPGLGEALDSALGDLVFLAFFLLVMALLFPPLVRYWWGCRPLPPGPTRVLAEQTLALAGVSVSEILTWPILGGRMLTAGVLGLFPRLRYLLITPALVENLLPTELMGVVAHEAGHVCHHHLARYLVFFLGFFVLAYALGEPLSLLAQVITLALAGSNWGFGLLTNPGESGLVGVLMALPLILLMLVYLRYVVGFFMRHFERQADLFALDLLGEPSPLVGALERVGELTGHSRAVSSWHHFSIAQRVAVLTLAAHGGGNARAQVTIIRRGFKAYVLGLALLALAGWGVQDMDLGDSLRQSILARLFENRLAANPHDARLRLSLGTILFEQGEEESGIEQLRLALSLAPNDPEVINGLAWMLATARDSDLRDPEEALALASEAVAMKPEPHIWDTVAEAYYVNGEYARAAAAARSALAAGPKERRYYFQAQIERFARAAGERLGEADGDRRP
jgi:Zn-dependent protease with chaperone function